MIQMLLPVLGGVLDKILPDTNARKAAKEQLEVLEHTGELSLLMGQLEINKQEAAHKSLFVSGWRPAVGWVCAIALGYNTLIHSIISIWFTVPAVQTELLYPVLMGLLGLGGMRSFEKFKGVARS